MMAPSHRARATAKALTYGELITVRQLVAVRAICNEQGIDQERACAAFFEEPVKPEELGSRQRPP